ncbi:MAG: hypothetical protein HOP07_18560 [Bacteriovoracaceae bacterium]|nr:hypothetical protein [Bacteriovoracaceae bacterium]
MNREKPQLVATGHNQVWSWDVSQIKSECRSVRFYLYVIVDIWSRLVVGGYLRITKIRACNYHVEEGVGRSIYNRQGTDQSQRQRSNTTSHEMIKFVRDAQMVDSYSMLVVSDDNPFSESLFGTIKPLEHSQEASLIYKAAEIIL